MADYFWRFNKKSYIMLLQKNAKKKGHLNKNLEWKELKFNGRYSDSWRFYFFSSGCTFRWKKLNEFWQSSKHKSPVNEKEHRRDRCMRYNRHSKKKRRKKRRPWTTQPASNLQKLPLNSYRIHLSSVWTEFLQFHLFRSDYFPFIFT